MAVNTRRLNKMQCKFGVNMGISSKSIYKSGRLMRIEERLFENYGLDTKQITERLLERFGKKKRLRKFTGRRKAGFNSESESQELRLEVI